MPQALGGQVRAGDEIWVCGIWVGGIWVGLEG